MGTADLQQYVTQIFLSAITPIRHTQLSLALTFLIIMMITFNLSRFRCLAVVALLAKSATAALDPMGEYHAAFRGELTNVRGRRLGASGERGPQKQRRGSIKVSAHRTKQLDKRLRMTKMPVPPQPNVEVVQTHAGRRIEFTCAPYTKPKLDRDALLMQKRRQRFEARGGHSGTNSIAALDKLRKQMQTFKMLEDEVKYAFEYNEKDSDSSASIDKESHVMVLFFGDYNKGELLATSGVSALEALIKRNKRLKEKKYTPEQENFLDKVKNDLEYLVNSFNSSKRTQPGFQLSETLASAITEWGNDVREELIEIFSDPASIPRSRHVPNWKVLSSCQL